MRDDEDDGGDGPALVLTPGKRKEFRRLVRRLDELVNGKRPKATKTFWHIVNRRLATVGKVA